MPPTRKKNRAKPPPPPPSRTGLPAAGFSAPRMGRGLSALIPDAPAARPPGVPAATPSGASAPPAVESVYAIEVDRIRY